MSPVTGDQRRKAIGKVASRLKFPQLFAVMAGLFIFDMLVPDVVPFIDEILLGLGTALFGLWREQVGAPEEAGDESPPSGERPMKDVTPPGEGRSGGGA